MIQVVTILAVWASRGCNLPQTVVTSFRFISSSGQRGVSALKPKLKAFFVGEMDGEEDDLMSGNRSGNAYALFPI